MTINYDKMYGFIHNNTTVQRQDFEEELKNCFEYDASPNFSDIIDDVRDTKRWYLESINFAYWSGLISVAEKVSLTRLAIDLSNELEYHVTEFYKACKEEKREKERKERQTHSRYYAMRVQGNHVCIVTSEEEKEVD